MPTPKSSVVSLSCLPVVALVILAISLAVIFPLPVNPGLDFSQFYIDLFGILRGDPIYQQLSHSLHYAESTFSKPIPLNPPAYPPWYYAMCLPLGLFSIETSAQIWAWCNIAMFLGALLLLTDQLTQRLRIVLIACCLLFAPVIGHIVVGQQAIVVLLGVALVLRGVEGQSSSLTAGGLLLLSFKPHLGAPIGVMVILWLLLKHSPLAVSVLARSVAGLALLILLSLTLDLNSLIDYPDSLRRLSQLSLNQICDTCSSLALTIQRSFELDSANLWSGRFCTSLALGALFILPLFLIKLSDRAFISASVCAVLLTAPYIRNYDYVLLLAPLVALGEEGLIRSRSRRVRSFARKCLCILGFFIAGILPLLSSRESHHAFLWIAALLIYSACFTGRQR